MAEYAPVFLKWLGFVRLRRENTVLSYGEDLKTFLRFCEQAGLSQPADAPANERARPSTASKLTVLFQSRCRP